MFAPPSVPPGFQGDAKGGVRYDPTDSGSRYILLMSILQPDNTKANILVVDDHQHNLHLLENFLTARGYRVRAALNGPSALSSVQTELPDLILLDVMMPGMSGYHVCERVKADEATRHIPIIFISALDDVSDKIQGFAVGGVDYITKPFQKDEVLARVETHLTLRRLHQQLESQNAQLHQEITTRQQAENALQQAHDELEIRIRNRTAELRHANARLEQEIEERKKTEQQLQEAFSEITRLKDRLEQENIYLQEEIKLEHNFEEIIGQSDLLDYSLYKIEKVAPTDTTVLILGETGTGKELFARAIHHASQRKNRPLIKVSCAALPAHLIESELFGHEKGAFTGAAARRIGRFELANDATLFLDEIGELPLELQAKLLRILQEGEFERLGSSQTITVDVRIIAATNRDLEQEICHGRFRQDLYYRLKVYDITIPPLRQRKEDIPLLVEAFVQHVSKKLGKHVERIPHATMTALQNYSWPGNVRELENLIEQAVINLHGSTLHVELPHSAQTPPVRNLTTPDIEPDRTLEEFERDYITHILRKTTWQVAGSGGAAQILGINPSTLRSRMQKLGIKKIL